MAVCGTCNQEMCASTGCTRAAGDPYIIRYGDETRYDTIRKQTLLELRKSEVGIGFDPEHRCHDCNVKYGEFHHPGCDMEECPHCHHQAISCGCADEDECGD